MTSYGTVQGDHGSHEDTHPTHEGQTSPIEDDNRDDDDPFPHDNLLKLAKSKYDMKNHMANERTFFKYLFTGLHIGSIGTLVLSFFPSTDLTKLYLVLVIWLIAFGFMFFGLTSYYRRKYLMENGFFKDSQMLNPHTPLIITVIFVFVIFLVILYAVSSDQLPLTSEPPAKDPSVIAQKLQQAFKEKTKQVKASAVGADFNGAMVDTQFDSDSATALLIETMTNVLQSMQSGEM